MLVPIFSIGEWFPFYLSDGIPAIKKVLLMQGCAVISEIQNWIRVQSLKNCRMNNYWSIDDWN
jgi:hypothetical protein